MTFILAANGSMIFLAFVLVMIAVLAFTAFARKGGQSDISQHPVDGRDDVAPGSGRPSKMSSAENAESPEGQNT